MDSTGPRPAPHPFSPYRSKTSLAPVQRANTADTSQSFVISSMPRSLRCPEAGAHDLCHNRENAGRTRPNKKELRTGYSTHLHGNRRRPPNRQEQIGREHRNRRQLQNCGARKEFPPKLGETFIGKRL